FLARESRLPDRALGERAELAVDVLELGALLDVQPQDPGEAAAALDAQVDTPLATAVAHDLHCRAAGQVALVVRLVGGDEGFQLGSRRRFLHGFRSGRSLRGRGLRL